MDISKLINRVQLTVGGTTITIDGEHPPEEHHKGEKHDAMLDVINSLKSTNEMQATIIDNLTKEINRLKMLS